MKLEEVINVALTYLGEEDYDAGKDKAQDDKIKLLVRCVNIMIAEIAQEYFPLEDETQVTAVNGSFSYADVPRRVLRIVSVKDGDSPVRFRQRPFSCVVNKDGRLNVRYRYLPESAAIGDECEVDPSVSAKTLALGAAAEYCMINGMYEQSEGFAERFRQDIRTSMRPASGVSLKERGWY